MNKTDHVSLLFSLNETRLTQVVPHVHLSAQSSDFDDALAQEIIRFPFETLFHPRLDIVILIPHTHFDSV